MCRNNYDLSQLTDEQIGWALQEVIYNPHKFLDEGERKYLIWLYNEELRQRRNQYYTT